VNIKLDKFEGTAQEWRFSATMEYDEKEVPRVRGIAPMVLSNFGPYADNAIPVTGKNRDGKAEPLWLVRFDIDLVIENIRLGGPDLYLFPRKEN
jgi:hypothetical protein